MARLVQALPSLAQAWARRGPSGGALSGFDEPLLAKGLELGVYWEVEGDVPAVEFDSPQSRSAWREYVEFHRDFHKRLEE